MMGWNHVLLDAHPPPGAKGAAMSLFDQPPLHDFPDRAIRELLQDPRNLRDLLTARMPDLAARFDFARVEIVEPEFLLDDWRRRKADLLFRIPFATQPPGEPAEHALICLLLEHQSGPDPQAPLRTLLYAVLYWEQEWKLWEEGHPRGEPLRLTPVLPVVFHTGAGPWRTNRTLADLIAAPEVLQVYVPRWQPLFWDLAENAPQELVAAAGEWMQALAVVRAEREEREAFQAVFTEVLRRLEPLSERENVRWHDLVRFVLSWAFWRRPGSERRQLVAAAQNSQSAVARRQEMQRMSETIERTWPEELLAEGALRAGRAMLQALLEERFGALPESLVERIETSSDLERLQDAARQVLHIQSPAELEL
jgi:putative YhgA-like transposase